jgi:hypothetical protein
MIREPLEPEDIQDCIVCRTTGTFYDGRWIKDAEEDEDDDGVPYFRGEDLPGAGDVRKGWVCSDACRAEAVYETASEAEQKSLDAVIDACRVLVQEGPTAVKVLEANMPLVNPVVVNEAQYILNEIGEAEWADRDSRETDLEVVMRRTAVELRVQAVSFGFETQVFLKPVPERSLREYDDLRAIRAASKAATMARLATELEEACS